MPAVLAVIFGWVGSKFTFDVAKAVFEKAVLYSLFTVVLPIVLWNLFAEILSWYMGQVSSAVGDGVSGMIFQATGLLAWVLNEAQVPLCISILTSALVFRFTLNAMTLRP